MSTSCRIDMKNVANADPVQFEKSELIGRWAQTGKMKALKSPDEVQVSNFTLKNDFTAEVEILDTKGAKTIAGSWEIGNEQKIGSFSLKSDMALTFDSDDSHRQIMAFTVKQRNNKKILTALKGKFEKE